ncbi:MAG TPA: cold shock domain-containing protein [Candidatus Deferrimicrobium sp.]|nr:cold shock domain-containing protein [Candidatus Deferrimicrobium sp.]
MSKGKVKYFNDLKGWGIIAPEESQEDVYVHYTAINMNGFKTLREGQEVVYEIVRTDSGPRARNVTLAV